MRQWIIGKDDFDYCALRGMPLSFAKARRSHFNKAMASQSQSNHIERIGTDGQEKYVLRVYYPLIDSDGNTELVIGYGVDISDQILNERYARQQEKRVKNIFEISRDGLFLMDEQGEVLTRNTSLLAVLGLRTTSFKKNNFIKLLDEQTQPEFLQKLKEVSRTKTVQSGTFDYQCRQSGQLNVLDYSVVPLAMATEKGYIVRVSDITEIVNKERNLEQTVAKEKQLNNYKSQFMRITSHELRTPLTIILANTEILQIIQKDPVMGRKINPDDLTNKIVKEVHIMIEILNQLMIVNKIETGDIELQKEQIDIEAYITDLVKDFFSPAPDGRELTVHIAPNLGEWQLDGKLLKYALVNILGNAFKYSHQRVSPILWVSEVDDSLEFRVKDFGIGIPENEVGSLFTSFFRASNVGTISGTGVGLMVVEYAVKRHQGTIAIHSVLKKGTEIVINIPRKT